MRQGCPCMAGYVERQREIEPEHGADLPDALVQTPLDIPVSFITAIPAQHGQQIVGIRIRILVYQGFQARLYLYLQQLVRLAPAVGQHIAGDVLLLQITHIDERHTTGIQTELE